MINISWSSDLAHGFINEKVPFKDLWQLTYSDFNYTFGSFQKSHRKIDNWNKDTNALCFDIDDGLSLNDATQIILSLNINALICTTKSHRKDKHGIICDRFRIIIPVNGKCPQDAKTYSEYYTEACKLFNNAPDRACKDPSRFYYGNANQKWWYLEGVNEVNWNWLKPKEKKPCKNITKKKINNKIDHKRIVSWFINNTKPGNRNNMLYRASQYAKDHGIDKTKFVEYINDRISNPLSDKELSTLLRKK